LPQFSRSDAQLFRKQSLPGFRNYQMNALDARVLFEQHEYLLRQ